MTAATTALEFPGTVTLVEEFAETLNKTLQFIFLTGEEDVPASFFQGLKECDNGFVVDMGKSLNDPPSPREP